MGTDGTGRKTMVDRRASGGLGVLLTSSLVALALVALSLLGALPFLPLPPWLQGGLLLLAGAGIVAGRRAVQRLPAAVALDPPATGNRAAADEPCCSRMRGATATT